MTMYIIIIVFLPLISSCFAGLFGRNLGSNGSSRFASICLTFVFLLISCDICYEVAFNGSFAYVKLINWIDSGTLNVSWGFIFDSLTVSMCCVVSFVSFLFYNSCKYNRMYKEYCYVIFTRIRKLEEHLFFFAASGSTPGGNNDWFEIATVVTFYFLMWTLRYYYFNKRQPVQKEEKTTPKDDESLRGEQDLFEEFNDFLVSVKTSLSSLAGYIGELLEWLYVVGAPMADYPLYIFLLGILTGVNITALYIIYLLIKFKRFK